MTRCTAVAALLLSAFTAPAIAQMSPWYVGGSIGESRTDSALVANRESTVVNAAVLGSTFDAKDGAFKLAAGYTVTPYLSIELNYADLGESHLATRITNQGQAGQVDIDRRLEGFGLDLVGRLPIGERAALLGRLGLVRTRLEATATLTGNIVFTGSDPDERSRSARRDETVTRVGIGGEWMITPCLGLRVEWERWLDVGKPFAIGGSGTTGEADTDFYSAGVTWRF